MVNNFEKIKDLLEWKSDDDFYFLQILQRKKDHVAGKINGTNNNSRLIKAYYVKSLEHLEFIEPEVIQLCEIFNARAGINLNKRSFEKMALQHLKKVTDQIINKSFDKAYKAYSSVTGAYHNETDKKWIIDIDEDELQYVSIIKEVINECAPFIDNKLYAEIPSKSGLHLITSPFNIETFHKEFAHKYGISVDIQKNNPTNCYIP